MALGLQVAIGTTPTVITNGVNVGDTDSDLVVKNRGANSVFLGGDNVTTSDGFELVAGDAVGIQLSAGEGLYGVVAAGTETVHALRTK